MNFHFLMSHTFLLKPSFLDFKQTPPSPEMELSGRTFTSGSSAGAAPRVHGYLSHALVVLGGGRKARKRRNNVLQVEQRCYLFFHNSKIRKTGWRFQARVSLLHLLPSITHTGTRSYAQVHTGTYRYTTHIQSVCFKARVSLLHVRPPTLRKRRVCAARGRKASNRARTWSAEYASV